MFYVISVVLIIASYFIGKIKGYYEGERATKNTFEYVYKTETQIYDQAYRKGVRDTRKIFGMKW